MGVTLRSYLTSRRSAQRPLSPQRSTFATKTRKHEEETTVVSGLLVSPKPRGAKAEAGPSCSAGLQGCFGARTVRSPNSDTASLKSAKSDNRAFLSVWSGTTTRTSEKNFATSGWIEAIATRALCGCRAANALRISALTRSSEARNATSAGSDSTALGPEPDIPPPAPHSWKTIFFARV
jgi:hypothetical protein